MRHHWRAVIFGILIICGGTISTYVFNYMTTFAITTLHLSPTIGTVLALTGSVGQIAGMAVGAWLDRFGRKRMLIVSRVLFVMVVYPAYVVLTSPQAAPVVIVAINVVINFIFGTRNRRYVRISVRRAFRKPCDRAALRFSTPSA